MPGGLGRASVRLWGARPGTGAEGLELGYGEAPPARGRRFLGDRRAGSAAAMGHSLPRGQEVGTARSGVAAVVAAVRFPASGGRAEADALLELPRPELCPAFGRFGARRGGFFTTTRLFPSSSVLGLFAAAVRQTLPMGGVRQPCRTYLG